jgi:hypothetical protein
MDVLATMPFRWEWMMPALMAELRPRSSAFTISFLDALKESLQE